MTLDDRPSRPVDPDPDSCTPGSSGAGNSDPGDSAFVRALDEALRLQDEGTLDREDFARRYPDHADAVISKLAFMDALVEPDAATGLMPTTPIPTDGPSLIGRRLGDFVLEREIGRGGMGVVFAAHQTSLDRRVAVKLLPPVFATEGRLRDRFEREATAAARLAHPAIVKVHAFGEDEATLFLAMEFVDGPSLAEVFTALHERRDPGGPTIEGLFAVVGAEPGGRGPAVRGFRAYLDAMVDIARVIADALEAAHQAGLVHRDVKPGNILIDHDVRPHLSDFGLVQAAGSRQITISGQLLGTPGFMAPEMVRGQETDHRIDVFSLGVVLYQALTLQLPFVGDSAPAVVRKVLLTDPPPLERVDRRIPHDLSNVVMRALEKSPERRYPTAAALRDDLQRFLRGDPVLASRVGPLSRAVRRVRRRPLAAAIALCLLLAVSAVAVLLVIQRQERAADLRRARDLSAEAEASAVAGNIEAALLAFREALHIDPSLEAARARVIALERQLREARLDATRHTALSVVMQVFRDPELADAAARRVAALDFGEAYAREVEMLRAIIAFVQRRPEDALAHAATVERLGDSAAVHFLRCWIHTDRDELEAAREQLAKARALPCTSLEDHVLGAEVSVLFGEDVRALELLREARAKWPRSPHVPFKLGILHKDRGHRETAIEAFTTAIQLAPDHVASLTERGYVYLGLSQHDLARADFDKALALEPNSAWATAGLHAVLVATGKYAEADALLKAALVRAPDSAVLLNTRGYVHLFRRRPEQAIADFRAAIRLWPDHAYAHTGLARAVKAAGRGDEALQVIAEGLKRPGLSVTAKVDLLNNRAIWRWRDTRAAEADLRAALEMQRKPMILANLGLLYLQTDRFGDALPFFSEQMSTGYYPWVARARRGYCRWMLLDVEGGLVDCEAAVREIERRDQVKTYPWILYNLALVQMSLGDDAAALALGRRAAALQGENAVIPLSICIRRRDTAGAAEILAAFKCPEPYSIHADIWLTARRGDVVAAARKLAGMGQDSVHSWPTPTPWIGVRWAANQALPEAARAAGRRVIAARLDPEALSALDLSAASEAVRAERDWLVGHALFDQGKAEAALPHLAHAAATLGWNYLLVEHAAALARLRRGAEAVEALRKTNRNWNRRATATLLLLRGVRSGLPELDAWLREPPGRAR